MENKQSLLKVLLNRPEESPEQNRGDFYLTSNKSYSAFPKNDRKITYNDFTIILYNYQVFLFDKDGNQLLNDFITSNGTQYSAYEIAVDNEGNFYAITYLNTKFYLMYLNNFTVKNTKGNYKIQVKKRYNLDPLFTALDEAGFWGRFHFTLSKSPYSSSFLILIDGYAYQAGVRNLALVKYNVNFEGDNDFNLMTADLPGEFAHTGGTFISWTQDDVSGTLINITADTNLTYNTETAVTINKVVFKFSSDFLEQLIIDEVNNFVSSEQAARNASIVTEDSIYLFIQTHEHNYITSIYEFDGTLTTLQTTNETTQKQYISPAYLNRNLFYVTIVYNGTNYDVSFMQKINGQISVRSMGTITSVAVFFIICNVFNLYFVNICGKGGVLVFGDYTGTPYFSNKAVTPKYMTLFRAGDLNSERYPIFSRNLYNVSQIGNALNSTLQIPAKFLNDEIVGRERLNSITNLTLTDVNKEITKNNYEELYINNIESFKVYDNEGGYNQDSTIQIVKNIQNGFENKYQITNVRVYYKDGTTANTGVTSTEIVNGVGKIHIYLFINKLVDYIKLFDKNYTKPFVKIDMSSCELNKMYHITQKVRIE